MTVSILVATTGCNMGELGEGLGKSLSCMFDGVGPFNTIESDNENLRAVAECVPGSDCVDRRTMHQGAKIDFVIEVGESLLSGDLEVRSEPEGQLEITGFANRAQDCRNGREISGTIAFSKLGEGAFVVLSSGKELDRFSVEVQKPELLDVQFSEQGVFGEFSSTEDVELLMDDSALRAIVRGESGDRLVGGPPVNWTIIDSEIATFAEVASTASGSTVTLYPGESGKTKIQVSVGDMKASVDVEVGAEQGLGGAGAE